MLGSVPVLVTPCSKTKKVASNTHPTVVLCKNFMFEAWLCSTICFLTALPRTGERGLYASLLERLNLSVSFVKCFLQDILNPSPLSASTSRESMIKDRQYVCRIEPVRQYSGLFAFFDCRRMVHMDFEARSLPAKPDVYPEENSRFYRRARTKEAYPRLDCSGGTAI